MIGISGGCRCNKMSKMKLSVIEDFGYLIDIAIPDTKQ